jgi:hypothetical protein
LIQNSFDLMKFSLTDLIKNGIPSARGDAPAKQIDPAIMAEAKRQLRAEALARTQARQAQQLAKQARADEKRRQAYEVRAVRREAIIKNLTSKMTAAELGRWGKLIDTIRGHAVKRNTTSADLRIDLGMTLPPEILTRAGLKADQTNVAWTVTGTAPKDPWQSRAYPTGLVRDDQPAADGKMVISAQDIIDAAAKAHGPIPEDKQVGRGEALHHKDKWLKR